MDHTTLRSDRTGPDSDSERAGGTNVDNHGESSELDESTRTPRVDGARTGNQSAAAPRRKHRKRNGTTRRKAPEYTRPPVLNDSEPSSEPIRRSKPDRATVTRKACGAVVGVVFLTASFALTGTMQLAATEDERKEIGGALSDGLSYLDDAAPFVKLLNVIGPWSGVIDGLANAIYRRVVYISDHRRGRAAAPPSPQPSTPPINGRTLTPAANEDEDIVAPNPASWNG